MPWEEKSIMEQRKEFILLASREGANIRELCRRYRISQTTAYKWLERYRKMGIAGLENQSRQPTNSPKRSLATVETTILKARETHPKWGARKLKRWLEDGGGDGLAERVHRACDFATPWPNQRAR